MIRPMNASPANLVNLSNYPLTALGSDAGQELIARMRAELDRDGACCLRNFLTDKAVERLADEARIHHTLRLSRPAGGLALFLQLSER